MKYKNKINEFALVAIPTDHVKYIQNINPDDLSSDDFIFEILHLVFYEAEPRIEDYLFLYNEMKWDDKFTYDGDFIIFPANINLIKAYLKNNE